MKSLTQLDNDKSLMIYIFFTHLFIFIFFILLYEQKNLEYTTSLIIKRHIVDKKRRELFRCDYAFENEIIAYCHLIPVLKKFSNDNLPYPCCLFAGCDGAGEIIVMKDLKEDGYKMANRMHGLDFEHCSLVLKVSFKEKSLK